MEKIQEVVKMLEDLGNKYQIPTQELEPIAKACGQAIAQSTVDQIDAKYKGLDTAAMPMDTGADELAGALGGR